MYIKTELVENKYYHVTVIDDNGNPVHVDACYIRDIDRMINELNECFEIE